MSKQQTFDKGGVVSVAVSKDRVRLTVYLESEYEERFRGEAESMYRSLSDHINAILAERYGPVVKAARAHGDPIGRAGQ